MGNENTIVFKVIEQILATAIAKFKSRVESLDQKLIVKALKLIELMSV